MVSHVDLCSGIGGFSLGFRWAGLSENPYILCDFEPWCRDILRKNFPGVPIADDVKEIASDPTRFIPKDIPRPYILTSGYPCQPFSQAGKRRGKKDPRHIYPYISSIVSFTRPDVIVFENVYGHVSLGLDEVLHDLEAKDYAARTFVFPSGAIVGLPHQRNRLWIIAHANSKDEPDGAEHEERMVADSNVEGLRSWERGSISEPLQENDRGNNNPGGAGDNDSDQDGKPQIVSKDAEDVADSENIRGKQTEWQGGESVGGGSQNIVGSKTEREDAEGTRHVSNTSSEGLQGRNQRTAINKEWEQSSNSGSGSANVSNSISQRGRGRKSGGKDAEDAGELSRSEEHWQGHVIGGMGDLVNGIPPWVDEPNIPRVEVGQAERTNRLKGLGNAIVPQIAMIIGEAIKKELTK
jgi:DNA (cytosine-5)-methyltransferase 1